MLRRGGRHILAVTALATSLSAACQNYSDKPADVALQERNLRPVAASSQAANSGALAASEIQSESYDTGDADAGSRQEIGGMSVQAPGEWRRIPPSNSMRLAEFEVPGAGGSGSASLAIFKGNYGTVDANVDRWVGQFTERQGDFRRWELELEDGSGHKATMVDVSGTFGGGMGGSAQTNQRMLGAIVEGGGEFYYLKLIGPKPTIDRWADGFQRFVKGVQTQ